MPANKGLGSPNWNPQPDFLVHNLVEAAVDERVFSIYSESDVARCLEETDPQIESYRWSLTNEDIGLLALESAQMIIKERRELLLQRQLELARAARKDAKKAVVAGIIENLVTGETTVYAAEVPMGRAFG